MKLNQRYYMNALPCISHRLLVATVPEHRSVHTLSAVENKPVIIDSDANRNAHSSDVQEPVSTERGATARRSLTRGKISAAWPFFE